MASLFALTGLAVWRLTVALAAPFGWRIAQVLGGAATVLTLYGGNLHSALYSLFHSLMPTTKEAFYFPDSTRFIGFDPPTGDKGFTEFIAYAFAAGDLHAHVVATPVFLLGLLGAAGNAAAGPGRTGARPDAGGAHWAGFWGFASRSTPGMWRSWVFWRRWWRLSWPSNPALRPPGGWTGWGRQRWWHWAWPS